MILSWTTKEKRDLLVALETHGPKDLTEIQKYLPEKSVTEIRCIIQKYKQMAHSNEQSSETSKGDESVLNQWIKVVKTLQSSQSIDDMYPRLFKYISLFEDHTADTQVNIKECYFAISELMKGESIKELDPFNANFLRECLSDLAHKIKGRGNTDMVDFIKSIENLDQISKANLVKSYSKKKTDFTLNPLRVPDTLLKLKNNEAGPSVITQSQKKTQ